MSEAEALAKVRELLEHAVDPWQPDAGESISGIVKARRRGNTSRSKEYPVITVDAGGERWLEIHAWHRVLWDELEAQRPEIGDAIGITYLGKMRTNDGTTYDGYRLVVVPVGSPTPATELADVPRAAAREGSAMPAAAGSSERAISDGGLPAAVPVSDASLTDQLIRACEIAGIVSPVVALNAANPARTKAFNNVTWRRASDPELRDAIAWALARQERPA